MSHRQIGSGHVGTNNADLLFGFIKAEEKERSIFQGNRLYEEALESKRWLTSAFAQRLEGKWKASFWLSCGAGDTSHSSVSQQTSHEVCNLLWLRAKNRTPRSFCLPVSSQRKALDLPLHDHKGWAICMEHVSGEPRCCRSNPNPNPNSTFHVSFSLCFWFRRSLRQMIKMVFQTCEIKQCWINLCLKVFFYLLKYAWPIVQLVFVHLSVHPLQ